MTESTARKPRVGVVLYPGCIAAEVLEVASRLTRTETQLHWVSPSGEPVVDESGLVLTPTASFAMVADTPLDALIVPGGDPGSVLGNELLRSIVTRTATVGVVAGICGGVLVLADAGVLKGHKITHNFRSPWSPPPIEEHVAHLFADVEVEADRSIGVVVDQRIVTALPNATAAFSLSICEQLGIYDAGVAGLLTRHLQGQFVPELFE